MDTPVATTQDDEFSEAFDLASAEDQPAVEQAEDQPAVEQAEQPAAEQAEQPAVEQAEQPAVEQAEGQPAAEPAAQPEPEWKQEAARLRAEMEQMAKARATPAAEEPAPAPAEQPAAQASPLYTPEEQAALEAYQNDWPDIAKAEALVRRAEYVDLLRHVFSEVGKMVAPLQEHYSVSSEQAHYNAIKSAHSDYDNIYDDVMAWAEQQPGYMRKALNEVIQHGTADEVVEMLNDYKKARGITSAPSNAQGVGKHSLPVVESTQHATDIPAAAKQAASKLGAVSTKRSVAPAARPEATDFESAFDEFADI